MSNVEWHGTVAKFPDLYDILHAKQLSDVAFYVQLCEGGRVALECGAGTGRVTIPLARSGARVTAIDSSPAMISALESRIATEPPDVRERLRVVSGDMRQMDLGKDQYDVAIIPYMTFNYLASVEEQVNCLRAIRKHLRPTSELIVEFISMYPPWFHNDGVLRLVKREPTQNVEGSVEVLRMTHFDCATQTLEHYRYFRWFDPEGVLLRERRTTLRNRFFFRGEAELMLEKAGFRVAQVWGDHTFGAYTAESQVFIIKARPA
jgi:SAM-dependent methyltransferase